MTTIELMLGYLTALATVGVALKMYQLWLLE